MEWAGVKGLKIGQPLLGETGIVVTNDGMKISNFGIVETPPSSNDILRMQVNLSMIEEGKSATGMQIDADRRRASSLTRTPLSWVESNVTLKL